MNTANDILLDINNLLFDIAKKFRDENSKNVSSKGEFFDYFKFEHVGFAYATDVVARRSHNLSFLNKKVGQIFGL